MAQTNVPVVLKVFAERSASVNAVLDETRKEYGKLAGSIEEVARTSARVASLVAAAFSGIALAITGVIAATVKVAGEFEQLKVKLESTLGSGEAAARSFANALQFAAKSPFDVQQVVQAQVILTTFGQVAERTLPIAANLAAAFGERINDVALVVGKAFSGSSRGFLSLTNQFGISNLVLQKYGAELTATGAISLKTAGDLEKARNALEKIVQMRFGDAVEKQSKTFFGVLSNLTDAFQRLGAGLGDVLLPGLNSLTLFLTSVVSAFEKLDPGFRAFVVYTALGGAALATIGSAAAVVAAGILGLVAVVIQAAGTLLIFAGALGTAGTAAGTTALAVAGLTTVGAAMADLLAVMGYVGPVFAAALGPVGVFILALAGGLAILNNYNNEVAATDKAMRAQADGLRNARSEFELYHGTLEKVTKTQGVITKGTKDIDEFGKSVREAFGNVSDAQFIENLQKAGLSLDDLRKAQSANREEAKALQGQMAGLSAVMTKLESGTELAFSGITAQNIQEVRKALGGQAINAENVGKALANVRERFEKLNASNLLLDQTAKRFTDVTGSMDEAKKSAQDLQTFLQYATKPDDTKALGGAMDVLNSKIGEVEANLKKRGVAVGDTAALQKRLIEGHDQEKAAVEELLKLYESRENITKKIASLEDKAVKDKITAVETQIERERLVRDVSLSEEKKRLSELLSVVKANSDEELSLRKKIKTLTDAEEREKVANAKTSLSDLAGKSKDTLEALRATGNATGTETVTAIEGILRQLDAWALKNKVLIDQNPQLRKELETTIRGFQKDLDTANLQIPKERLTAALDQAKTFGAEAVTNVQKLAAAQQALGFLTNVQASGQITTMAEKRKLQEEINRLTHEELRLSTEVTKEQRAQARETAGLKRDALQGELEVLKTQQKLEGESTFRKYQVLELEKQILAEKVQAIREQEQAEIDGGLSAEAARERTEIRMTQLKQQETKKRIEEEEKQTKSVADEAKKQEDIRNGFLNNRLGGKNSPLISQAELNSQLSFLPSFSLDLNGGRGGIKPPPSTLNRVGAQVDADISQGEKIRTRGGNTQNIPGTPLGGDATAAGNTATGAVEAAGSTTINQYNLGVSGYPIGSPEVEAAVRTIVDKILADKAHQGASA